MDSLFKLRELAGSTEGRKRVGHVLQLARSEAGLTQREAAEKIGVKVKTISSYETGRNRPTAFTFEKLSEIYEVEIASLYNKAAAKGVVITQPNQLCRIPIMTGKRKYSSRREFFMAEEPIGYGLADVGKPDSYIYLEAPNDDLSDYRIKEGDNVLIGKLEKPKDGDLIVVLLDGNPLVRKYEIITPNTYKLRAGDFTGVENLIVTDGAVDGKMVEHLGVVKMVMFTF